MKTEKSTNNAEAQTNKFVEALKTTPIYPVGQQKKAVPPPIPYQASNTKERALEEYVYSMIWNYLASFGLFGIQKRFGNREGVYAFFFKTFTDPNALKNLRLVSIEAHKGAILSLLSQRLVMKKDRLSIFSRDFDFSSLTIGKFVEILKKETQFR